MSTLEPLLLDLVEWVASAPRSHAEVMDVWRTSCPRLPVWEEAVERGYLAHRTRPEGLLGVVATPAGLAFLAAQGRVVAAAAGQPVASATLPISHLECAASRQATQQTG